MWPLSAMHSAEVASGREGWRAAAGVCRHCEIGSKRTPLPLEVVSLGASQVIRSAVRDLMRGAGFLPLLPA